MISEYQCLETGLNLKSDVIGDRMRTSASRSSLEATFSADVLFSFCLTSFVSEVVMVDNELCKQH